MPFSLNREKRYSLKQQKNDKTIAGGEAGGQIIGSQFSNIFQHKETEILDRMFRIILF